MPFQSWHTILQHCEINLEYYLKEKRNLTMNILTNNNSTIHQDWTWTNNCTTWQNSQIIAEYGEILSKLYNIAEYGEIHR